MKITKFPLKIAAVMCAFSLILSSFCACSQKTTELTAAALSDVLTIKISGEDEVTNTDILNAVKNAAQTAEKAISAEDEGSELSILNSTKTVYATDYFRKFIYECLLIGDITAKAANISVGSITGLWGFYGDSPAVPDEDELKKAVSGAGLWKIELSRQNNKISVPSDLSVDLYSVQNGIVLDNAYEAIKLFNTPVMLSLGKTVLVCGRGPHGGSWQLDITSPESKEAVAQLRITPHTDINILAVSTAQITDQSFTENGKTYHRFISPATGYPVETDLVSVTVTASSALNADALADACFISGFNEDTLRFLSYFGAGAVFIFNDGTCYVTDGLADSVKIKDRNLTLINPDITTD